MIQRMLAIWSLVPLPLLNTVWTSRSSWFTCCWCPAWRILKITLLACEMCAMCGSVSILWHCLSLGLEWKLTFSSAVATAEFSKFAGILSAALLQHHLLGFEMHVLRSMGLQRVGHDWVTELNWTESTFIYRYSNIKWENKGVKSKDHCWIL